MLRSRLFRLGRPLCAALGLALLSSLALGCQSGEVSPTAVARVGDYTLTQADLERRLEGLNTERDSAARAQIIEQWVRRTLLYREAERRDLAAVPAVQRRLERQRRSVLIAELTSRLYDDASLRPSDAEVRTYFERHKASLRLREPYVRVRYLPVADRAAAVAARQTLADRPAPTASRSSPCPSAALPNRSPSIQKRSATCKPATLRPFSRPTGSTTCCGSIAAARPAPAPTWPGSLPKSDSASAFAPGNRYIPMRLNASVAKRRPADS